VAKTLNGRTRIATAGQTIRRRETRTGVIALGALLLGGGVLAFAAFRPLPAPTVAGPPVLPSIAPPDALGDPIDARESRLSTLARSGNVFAPDRLAWAEDVEPPLETDEPIVDTTPNETISDSSSPLPAIITLTERPTAAAKKSRDALDLLGVFASGDNRFAMIRGGESDRRKDVEFYREDDVFFSDTWRVMRILPEHDRVIIEHLGQGDILALAMYDSEMPSIAVNDPPTTPSAAANPADAARADLLDAGIAQEEVDDVFEMLAALESAEGADAKPNADDTVAAAPEEAPPAPAGGRAPKEMPNELAGLLRSMILDAQKSRPPSGADTPSENPKN